MSHRPRSPKRQYVRCPMCSRQPVQVKRGYLVSHLTPGGLKCIATGLRIRGTAWDTKT